MLEVLFFVALLLVTCSLSQIKYSFNVGFLTASKQSYIQAAQVGLNFMTLASNYSLRPTRFDYDRNETVTIYRPFPNVEIQYNLMVEYTNGNTTLSSQKTDALFRVRLNFSSYKNFRLVQLQSLVTQILTLL